MGRLLVQHPYPSPHGFSFRCPRSFQAQVLPALYCPYTSLSLTLLSFCLFSIHSFIHLDMLLFVYEDVYFCVVCKYLCVLLDSVSCFCFPRWTRTKPWSILLVVVWRFLSGSLRISGFCLLAIGLSYFFPSTTSNCFCFWTSEVSFFFLFFIWFL